MAKRTQPIAVDNTLTELIISKAEFQKVLDERIAKGEELFNRPIQTNEDLTKNEEDYYSWNDYNLEYLKQTFNKEQNEYRESYDNASFIFFGTIGGNTSPVQKMEELKHKIKEKLRNLKTLQAKIDLLKTSLEVNIVSNETIVELDKSQVPG